MFALLDVCSKRIVRKRRSISHNSNVFSISLLYKSGPRNVISLKFDRICNLTCRISTYQWFHTKNSSYKKIMKNFITKKIFRLNFLPVFLWHTKTHKLPTNFLEIHNLKHNVPYLYTKPFQITLLQNINPNTYQKT